MSTLSTTSLVAKNTAIQIIGKVVSTALGIATIAIVTRALLPEGFGQYTKVITFLTFFGIVADLGLTLITAQMISERGADEPRIVRNIFTFRTLTALVLFGLAPVVVWFTPYDAIVKLGITLTACSFFFVSLQQTLVGIFQKHLVMHYPVIAENIGRVALVGVTAFAAWRGENLLWYLGAVVVGNFANFLATLWFARRYVAISFAWDRAIIRDMCHRAMPIAISIVFNLIYLKADMLILTFVRGDAEVGLYGAAYRVIDILMMVPVMLMGVILPIATRSWSEGDGARVGRVLQKTFDAFVLYALPIICGGFIVGERVMTLVAGDNFAPAGAPLKILLLAFGAATVSTLFGHTIVALQKQRSVIWVYGVDAVLSLAAYLVVVPMFGMFGAAWATFGSELFAAIVLGVIVIRVIGRRLTFATSARVIVATAIMCVVVALLVRTELSIVFAIAIGGATYLGAHALMRTHRQLL
ncbi:MAG: hypothetical protein A3C15_02925 [Candidatus Magasanikbacteria bacterium RIFCSPHIGHO2_02_FULL_50_9b]|uniref:Uncharacterized protein n=1 Tax=Candidatus Magasanikbacteria bacterium RIFCSPHIGHO2_02_FULL_50_9b TaxID=1798682 RepID=A0A1F6M834_9BACT|nr:MAG: hypothetical protein A3C15_02925 [Candidatus Magasanikbacteria bacterium RIFCSPHIGHO2_02_FULL_50_9b]